jgi:uncharacterized protein YecT (DUF1311 family)
MTRIRHAAAAVALGGIALVTSPAHASAYEDCMTSGNQQAVMQCLLNEDRLANGELASAEAAAAQKARSVEQATGKAGIHAALAKSVRDFAAYRASQCGFVRELAAREPIGEQAQVACRVDLTRRRARELKP